MMYNRKDFSYLKYILISKAYRDAVYIFSSLTGLHLRKHRVFRSSSIDSRIVPIRLPISSLPAIA